MEYLPIYELTISLFELNIYIEGSNTFNYINLDINLIPLYLVLISIIITKLKGAKNVSKSINK